MFSIKRRMLDVHLLLRRRKPQERFVPILTTRRLQVICQITAFLKPFRELQVQDSHVGRIPKRGRAPRKRDGMHEGSQARHGKEGELAVLTVAKRAADRKGSLKARDGLEDQVQTAGPGTQGRSYLLAGSFLQPLQVITGALGGRTLQRVHSVAQFPTRTSGSWETDVKLCPFPITLFCQEAKALSY